jgi:hypothetical protein
MNIGLPLQKGKKWSGYSRRHLKINPSLGPSTVDQLLNALSETGSLGALQTHITAQTLVGNRYRGVITLTTDATGVAAGVVAGIVNFGTSLGNPGDAGFGSPYASIKLGAPASILLTVGGPTGAGVGVTWGVTNPVAGGFSVYPQIATGAAITTFTIYYVVLW